MWLNQKGTWKRGIWSFWMNSKQLGRSSHQIFKQIGLIPANRSIIALCKLCHHTNGLNYGKISFTAEPLNQLRCVLWLPWDVASSTTQQQMKFAHLFSYFGKRTCEIKISLRSCEVFLKIGKRSFRSEICQKMHLPVVFYLVVNF